MKEYEIYTCAGIPADWSTVPEAMVSCAPWLHAYMPKTTAQVILIPGDAFYIRMTCAEKDPKRVYRNFFDDVYKDSCMEMFAAWDELSDRYINIEMNANGAALIAVGPDRYSRTRIDEIIEEPFYVSADIGDGTWSVIARVPLSDLAMIYGTDIEKFRPGYSFRGNFYKCGDETAEEHYLMWNPVETETPDFHRPEYFGRLTIK